MSSYFSHFTGSLEDDYDDVSSFYSNTAKLESKTPNLDQYLADKCENVVVEPGTSTAAAAEEEPDFVEIEGLTIEQHFDPIIDKIIGCIYGGALGDAFGLATEFETKAKVARRYKGKKIPFPDFYVTPHNSRWDSGDWTDDTDQLILILEMLNMTKGKVVPEIFAAKLYKWMNFGFPELGDKGGSGLGMTVMKVCTDDSFLEDPYLSSEKVWRSFNCDIASNGSIMRTSILGCHDFKNIDKVIANTDAIGKVTHWDPRCRAGCIGTTVTIALILQGLACSTDEEIKDLMNTVEEITYAAVPELVGLQKREFQRHMYANTLQELKLDESGKIGYALKCFGSGMYGLKTQKSYKDAMELLVREAGDADTNAQPCGSILGAKIGYTQLPHDWIAYLPNKAWLDRKIVKFLKVQKLIPETPVLPVVKPRTRRLNRIVIEDEIDDVDIYAAFAEEVEGSSTTNKRPKFQGLGDIEYI